MGDAALAEATRESEKPPEPEGPSDFSNRTLARGFSLCQISLSRSFQRRITPKTTRTSTTTRTIHNQLGIGAHPFHTPILDGSSSARFRERLRPTVQLADPVLGLKARTRKLCRARRPGEMSKETDSEADW